MAAPYAVDMPTRDAFAAGAWAAVLSGVPSTAHALARRRDVLEATRAAGSLLLPRETRTLPLVAAAVPVHVALSLGWALALERLGVRGAGRGAAAGLVIAAVDLGAVGRRFPRIRALPLAPQLADHVLYGTIVGTVLARRD
jgi:hypothetical protein